MKDALTALLISAALATVSTALFATGSGSVFRYLGFYVGMLAFWILPVAGYFLVRNILHNRRLDRK